MRPSQPPVRGVPLACLASLLRGAAALALGGALAAGAVACRSASDDGPAINAIRGQLKYDPQSLTLIGKRDRSSEIVARLVGDSLVQYDTSLIPRPGLAESWELTDDRRTVTFRLRRGVRWHDGAPVTARDVVFTIDKIRDPASEALRYSSAFADLEQLEALDEHTVRARYARPYADFIEGWWAPLVPEHLAGQDADLLTGEFSRRPVGCGPFRLVDYEPGVRLVFEANTDYWAGAPHVDRLVLRIFPDDRTAYQALLGGDLDVMNVTPDLWTEATPHVESGRLGRLAYHANRVWYIGWNQDGSNPFFGDARVRRAMIHSIDRQSFSDRLLAGLALLGVTTYHPESPWTDPALRPHPYDPDRARALLDEAGWTDRDGDGVRDRDGAPFAFTLLKPSSVQEISDRMAEWIQQSLAEVGVRMEIQTLEFRAFQERRRAHEFDAAMATFVFSAVPDTYEVYHSSQHADAYNYVGLADPEVDRLVDAGRRTFEEAARREIYHRLQRRLHELEPLSCLFHFATPVLHDARLVGIQSSPLDYWRVAPGPRSWRWIEPTVGG